MVKSQLCLGLMGEFVSNLEFVNRYFWFYRVLSLVVAIKNVNQVYFDSFIYAYMPYLDKSSDRSCSCLFMRPTYRRQTTGKAASVGTVGQNTAVE